ncbi:MAG TPA: DUF4331 family protein [Kofleriaceae bacterium]|nr:DUF4331 family protein [Kofleriaceae bacterium]
MLATSHSSYAADHGDATSLATNKAADITDVYAWMTADHSKVNLVLDVSPSAAAGDHFGTNILYVFHVQASAGFGMTPTAPPTDIICKFASDTSVQCWLGTEYVSGDPSNTAGISSTDGKVKVYAGQRNDPFFFNINGFKHVVSAVEGAAGGLGALADGHGCYDLHAAGAQGSNLGAVLVGFLAHDTDGTSAPLDNFAGKNVNAIVMQVDASLLTGGGTTLGVWASTNMIGQ